MAVADKKKKVQSLKKQEHELANIANQMRVLNGGPFADGDLPRFQEKLEGLKDWPLKPDVIDIFQVNVGYMCNQVCQHCHVDAGPDRKEIMTRETMQYCLDVLEKGQVNTLDMTGGAPEMNPDFRWFVVEARKRGVKEIIVRSNLTIIRANKKYHDLPEFFKENNVHVVSSLPFYTSDKTDRQRGDGVFDMSIEALKQLNAVGYGQEGSGLQLDLVYNPNGAFLPGDQEALQAEYKAALKERFDIVFNELFCITNIPISRYLDYLVASDNYEDYMYSLVEAFNPAAVKGIMCRNTISISWDGYMYDCDFNQMLDLKVQGAGGQHIKDFDYEKLTKRNIIVSQHCFGCTAGAGSSCQGTVA